MAVTGKFRLPEDQYPQSGYQGLAGVSENTAQKAQQAQQNYQPTQQAQAAQQQLQNVQNQRPQTYNSKYSAALDGILKEIQQPKKFKYSFDGDELFKYYADLYTQKGKQAAADVQGQAAALTGGYGNSYGQQVGQQTYDQYLLSLYDKGMDLRDRAYQKYRDDQAALQDQYNMLAAADQTDYGRYRDTLGDWENERAYWTQQEGTAYDRGYNEFLNERNYWTQQAGAENADYWTGRQMDENVRQYDTSMAENQRQFDASMAENVRQFDANLDFEKMSQDQKYAAQYALAILENGEMPTLELLKAAGLSQEDAQKLMAQLVPAGGGGPGKKKTTGDDDKDWSYLQARQFILRNTPLSTPLSELNSNYAGTDTTLQDLADQYKETKKQQAWDAKMNEAPANPTAEEMMKLKLKKGK